MPGFNNFILQHEPIPQFDVKGNLKCKGKSEMLVVELL